ncbi:alpha/beta hydrolase [Aestuariivirga sp. YIM B02566]|uniref:Dienelactone hydrolase family protein n=1 Tax=Taklimakanibacter albus TaxID=2800327 RepID=A0ACC5QY84_9HYPH|nr:dienelactone hydrolase family protein [Aestuariivirga sp. YIM B02566]MBK1865320.1 dienelactone hydrolase family protein [Aestuariivirga sp. YIM B02566]
MTIQSSQADRLIRAHHLHVAGTPLARASKVVIFIHGRHATGTAILPLTEPLAMDGLCFLAPDADTGSWYPGAFMAPIITNEPYLTNALERLGSIYHSLETLGFGREQIVLAGFSQGSCLVLEYAARHPHFYAGILGFSGGLIGPDPMVRNERGSFEGTRIFLGCSEKDPFIPAKRVLETAGHLEGLGAQVTARLYPGSDHVINENQYAHARAILTWDAVA